MPAESPERFFRQLLIVQGFIFYRLDRPMLPPKMWPEFLKILKDALKKALDQNEIPKEWLEEMWPGNHEYYLKQKAKYETPRAPLSLTGRAEIQAVFQKLADAENAAGKIAKKSERHDFLKYELSGICRRALRKAWEAACIIGLENL
jgi:hypothetical protein